MEFPTDPNLIVGLAQADDAGVYKINDELAIIQTVDFFTPIVDDPYWFGKIAAANALSDIYAMGGVPKTAMNLVAFPREDMDISVLRKILQGGLEKMKEAEVVLVGGHSVEDKELKYGLSVTGFIHPERIMRKDGFKLGDKLILTKPLGTGIINTAIKGGLASQSVIDYVTQLMATLNRKASEVMLRFPVTACTDITGFGLLGHMCEMVEESKLGFKIYLDKLPIIPEAVEYAKMGLIPAGTYRNREFRQSMVEIQSAVDRSIETILFDPQTSGGLLICIAERHSLSLIQELKNNGIQDATIVGEVVSEPAEKIVVV